MRKGIADMHRRVKVSLDCNERYLDALSTLNTDKILPDFITPVAKRVKWKKRSIRGLRPWTQQDIQLFNTINRGEFKINGFANKDILQHLFTENISSVQQKRRMGARVTRMIAMLRAHGIIKKVRKRYRYHLTSKGQRVVAAILQCQSVTVKQLNELAA